MFTKYNSIVYDGIKIRNILNHYTVWSENKNTSIFQDYTIINWESPETVAYKVYGSCTYEWAVLLANNIVDPFYDWLLKEHEVRYIIEKKYGVKAHDIHHWELNNVIYKYNIIGSRAVSNYQYEFDLNEKKRKIQVIIPAYVDEVLKEIQDRA